MSHTYTLISFGEKWHFKTDHYLDMDTRQVFEDLLSFRNINHWDEADLEYFLSAKGRLVSECITQLQSYKKDAILDALASEKFRNIKEMIVCVYGHSEIALGDYEKILKQVCNAVPAETKILMGLICDEKTDQNNETINFIAICAE